MSEEPGIGETMLGVNDEVDAQEVGIYDATVYKWDGTEEEVEITGIEFRDGIVVLKGVSAIKEASTVLGSTAGMVEYAKRVFAADTIEGIESEPKEWKTVHPKESEDFEV
jgi:hypothetical protein